MAFEPPSLPPNKFIIFCIICDDVTCVGQSEVSSGITGFYQKLYDKVQVDNSVLGIDDDFYSNCTIRSLELGSEQVLFSLAIDRKS